MRDQDSSDQPACGERDDRNCRKAKYQHERVGHILSTGPHGACQKTRSPDPEGIRGIGAGNDLNMGEEHLPVAFRAGLPVGYLDFTGFSSGAGWLMETGSEPGKLSSRALSSCLSTLRFLLGIASSGRPRSHIGGRSADIRRGAPEVGTVSV